MIKVTCPYCGAEMLLAENSDDVDNDDWNWWYECTGCGSRGPIAKDGRRACKKAMRRVG